jgi:acyl-CoA synthetase
VTASGLAVGHSAAEVSTYLETGLWGESSIADLVAGWAGSKPDALAFADEFDRVTWREYDEESTRLAGVLIGAGVAAGSRIAVLLPDSAAVHIAWVGAEKAGLVVVGIGPRAGDREVRHLLDKAAVDVVLSGPEVAGTPSEDFVASVVADRPHVRHLRIDDLAARPWRVSSAGQELAGADPDELRTQWSERRIGPSDLFMLNSTSGTTGLPKCVTHTQNRWMYFHQLAQAAGELNGSDVFCSAIPSPFGFGLWTAHVSPTVLGAPTHLMQRFSASRLVETLSQERVTVLAAVSTQFIMMLDSPALAAADLSALRVLFTGGEAVPYERAAEFERRTGARLLQFYGSNETGALSRTTMTDTLDQRLHTAGRVIPDMQVRLIDEASGEVTTTGRGQATCRGPAACEGYYDDDEANRLLYTDDGWMLTGDVVEIDQDGYLAVVGRISDIIIRGGKNISAPAVEAEVATHPAVAMAAAVSMPDPVFGERVCIYVQTHPGQTVTLEEIVDHLRARGVSREWYPERLELLDTLPSASGGKVAKAELRADIRRKLAEGQSTRETG